MQSNKTKKILKEYKDVFETLKNYDKTKELPFQRKRIYLTFSIETIRKLEALKEKMGKPISRIIEERLNC